MSTSFKIFLLVALSFLSSFNLSANDTFFSIEKSSDRLEDLAKAVGSVFKVGNNIAGKVVAQVKAGTNDKIAVIGRKMDGHVNEAVGALQSQGKQVEAFNDAFQSEKSFNIDGTNL